MNLYWQNYLPLFLHYYLFPKFKYYYTTSMSILWQSLLYFPGSLSQMICLSTTANTFYFKCDKALNKWCHFFKFSNERWFSLKYTFQCLLERLHQHIFILVGKTSNVFDSNWISIATPNRKISNTFQFAFSAGGF